MEFAIVVPLLVLLLCGTIDFGLIFGGYMTMESGLASATRAISLNQNEWSGPANSCTNGPNTGTADAVCNVVATLGSLTGLNPSTLAVGICFVTPGSSPSCGGSTPTTGTSDSQDVEVCAQAQMQSTTGLTSIFVSGSTVSTSSRLLLEEPQPPGPTAFENYNSTSTSVDFYGNAVPGLTCT